MKTKFWVAVLLLVVVLAGFFWFSEADETLPSQQGPAQQGTIAAPRPADNHAAGVSPAASVTKPAPTKPAQSQSLYNRTPFDLAADGRFVVPRQHRFAGVDRVHTGEDFESWMAQFTPQEQEVLQAFNASHFGVYEGRDRQQIAWMAAHGYPMPEDILAAQSMSESELLARAKAGSEKAAFLYRNRIFDQVAELMEAHDQSYGDVLRSNPNWMHTLFEAGKVVHQSQSPYRAFAVARYKELVYRSSIRHGYSSPSVVMAALKWADMLGDNHALDLLDQFVQSAPDRESLAYRKAVKDGLLSLGLTIAMDQGFKFRVGTPVQCMPPWGPKNDYPSFPDPTP